MIELVQRSKKGWTVIDRGWDMQAAALAALLAGYVGYRLTSTGALGAVPVDLVDQVDPSSRPPLRRCHE